MTAGEFRTVTVTVDGRRVTTEAGRTVAATLMLAEDRLHWRETRFAGKGRGLFCGIGVCFDCLVTVDGQPSLRACLVQVAEGMSIETEPMDG
ncbi:(2Fe-2S)-binding protein [Nesterenkonia sp. MY13]|uniref:(2Fe-2S)-binding protein n=1 Tax=Nesterenkonia sedimenti TaxID=1463632 RepID=A0A7X8YDH9_9MICC|nr:(2Fe-2S)-binding protein [Nesterenkonia sedimenti]NLS09683.1 (2Fe-2S)-binding protein [Nesterenkonia sedimenti]